jgi:hypothetical protein
METKAFYIKRLLSTFGICAIGLIIGSVLFPNIPLFEDSVFLTTVALAGLPFGWMGLRQVFGGMIVWGLWGTIIYFICMLAFSVAIGWMILCYRLVRDIVQLIIVCVADKKAATRA